MAWYVNQTVTQVDEQMFGMLSAAVENLARQFFHSKQKTNAGVVKSWQLLQRSAGRD
jgi:hypothetical protein